MLRYVMLCYVKDFTDQAWRYMYYVPILINYQDICMYRSYEEISFTHGNENRPYTWLLNMRQKQKIRATNKFKLISNYIIVQFIYLKTA